MEPLHTNLPLTQDELRYLLNCIGVAFKSGALTLGDAMLIVPLAEKIQGLIIEEPKTTN